MTGENIEHSERLSREQASVMGAYAINALVNTQRHIFREDLPQSIWYANNRTHWYNGSEITVEEKLNLASSDILLQLGKGIEKPELLILSPEVRDAKEFYQTTQATLDGIGISTYAGKLNKQTVRHVTRCFTGAEEPESAGAVAALDIWQKRGEAAVDMINTEDLLSAVRDTDYTEKVPDSISIEPNGMLVESHALPKTPVHSEVYPYYLSLFTNDRSKEWLSAILEDVVALDQRIS
jgi:hypothetical protein